MPAGDRGAGRSAFPHQVIAASELFPAPPPRTTAVVLRPIRGQPMYIPSARELVEIAGLPGLFLVLWVNRQGERADVMAMRESPFAVSDVPFARLRPYEEHPEPDSPDRLS